MTVGGRDLFELVEQYAALGDHRTGTEVDDSTRAWFGAQLASRGAIVTEDPLTVPLFRSVTRVRMDGDQVESAPLYYSGVGRALRGVEPGVATVELVHGVAPIELDFELGRLDPRCPGAVVFLTSSHGEVVGVNRSPTSGPDFPVVMVGRRSGEPTVAADRVGLDWTANVVDSSSATVVGRFGRGDRPLVVTTPLSGWFSCAGERGTGIAIALDLAAELAGTIPVLVVGTTGHELDGFGARSWLAGPGARVEPRAVVHLGASAAAGETDPDGGPLRFASLRFAMATEGVDRLRDVAAALEPAGLGLTEGPEVWPGEGEEWRRTGATVLSVTGAFEHFHRRTDLPDVATSPELLATARDAFVAAVGVLVERGTDRRP